MSLQCRVFLFKKKMISLRLCESSLSPSVALQFPSLQFLHILTTYFLFWWLLLDLYNSLVFIFNNARNYVLFFFWLAFGIFKLYNDISKNNNFFPSCKYLYFYFTLFLKLHCIALTLQSELQYCLQEIFTLFLDLIVLVLLF